MCGITGIFHYRCDKTVNPDVLINMRDAMVHRGPDGKGTWISPNRKVGLGHRRLAIVDLQAAASQPMTNTDASVWVVFNGEIYNHLELRRELTHCGYQFSSDHSDTEVLLHGYLHWGIDGLIKRLVGMFAFALYSCKEDALYLVRDRIGVKPLYFSLNQGTLLFGSEIKAITRYPGIEKNLAPRAMYHYLSFLATPAPMTMFEGIFKIPAGYYLKFKTNEKMIAQQYWDALPGSGIDPSELKGLSKKAKEDFYVQGVRKRLDKAVQRRMMSDAPYGAFLSGGIDSSANVALMSKYTDKPIKTFTVGFKDHKYLNELGYARKVAKHFKTDHHEILIDEQDMMGYIENMVYHQDEPLADWVCIPLYFVSKLAYDEGVKVVQVGEGADEQFSGYQGYIDFLNLYYKYWLPYRKHIPKSLQKISAKASQVLAAGFPSLGNYADIAERACYDREHFWTGATLFWETQKRPLVNSSNLGVEHVPQEILESGLFPESFLRADSFEIIRSFRDKIDKKCPNSDVLTRMIYNEFKQRLPELLLMRVDKISMSTSLEARVPFLDHELVEFTMDIPMEYKIGNGDPKRLLKKAVRGLIPDEIIDRPKMGFGAPMKDWLHGDFGVKLRSKIANSELVKNNLLILPELERLQASHGVGTTDNASYLWAVFNLVVWNELVLN